MLIGKRPINHQGSFEEMEAAAAVEILSRSTLHSLVMEMVVVLVG